MHRDCKTLRVHTQELVNGSVSLKNTEAACEVVICTGVISGEEEREEGVK